METAFLYPKGSPMLARYLELNGLKMITVDRHRNVWIENGQGVGFRTQCFNRREMMDLARKLADHTGLPFKR